MKWFKKNKVKAPSVANDQLARTIAGMILNIQRGWATWMNRQALKCPPKLRAAVLVLLFLFMAAMSMSLIFGVFGNHKKVIAQTGTIQTPATIEDNGRQFNLPEVSAAYGRVKKASSYLDSLAGSESGRKKLDSINRVRPGLADSIRMAELLYRQLKQKYEN